MSIGTWQRWRWEFNVRHALSKESREKILLLQKKFEEVHKPRFKWYRDNSFATHKEKYYAYLQSPEWAAKREKKLKQVGNKCELCGVGSDTHQLFIHHKNYYRVFYERMSDLEVLCEDGHDYRHSRRAEPCTNFKPRTILRKKKDMRKQCYCGEGFELYYKHKKQLLHGFDLFCSGACLLYYLRKRSFVRPINISANGLIYPSEMGEPFDYYCPITKRAYRSKSEAIFAIWCDIHLVVWEYEQYTIRFTATRSYTPDFWLPEYSLFVEVKGAWAGSAKKKLRDTVNRGYTAILIPDYLIRILDKENGR